ncbi:apolipoprotein N-acyltransferase [Sphingobium sp. DEHP117]|uniref:apolipoprotein N-acyltransferase n=1 Tax=Sphingobium sp. DEHP117 TaxID=2993436 RepID=UPI0027D52449|nr:apolipoprotein N-acyltransferase [Sphingobium sp. DEHP117]MDQ4420619.1 apolipoprotein N-acyltransferase [Sphingobium sp. DEHP117]
MRLTTRHPMIAAILLGALAATGFAPLGWWPLSLVAVAGLMALAERVKRAGGAFLLGWCFGLGHFTVGNNWIAHAFTYQDAMPHWLGYGAVVALALYLAVYPGLAVLGLYALRKRFPRLLVPDMFAALWIVSEYGRATIFTGFAWDPLGMIWLDTGVDQASRWIGTYGLSGLAVLAAGALLSIARGRWRPVMPLVVILGALATFGHLSLREPEHPTTIAVTIVQPNINQNEKYDQGLEETNFTKLAQLTGAPRPGQPRLIFWPEAAVPAWLDVEPEWRARLSDLLGPQDLLMLGGVKPYFREERKGAVTERTLVGAANSAWVLTADGQIAARYDKAHLVPYGEYLPMRGLLEPLGLSRLVPGDADFWPGPGPRSLPLPVGGEKRPYMGVQICYEMIFSGQVVGGPVRPAFLYNPSNDAWFGAWGPPQHLAQARMRSIEEAMPVIRSTPTGISALIDGRGRLIASIPHHQAGAINALLPRGLPPTLFARFGNILPMIVAALLALTAILLARPHRAR